MGTLGSGILLFAVFLIALIGICIAGRIMLWKDQQNHETLLRDFLDNPTWASSLGEQIDAQDSDFDRHRTYAYGMIDAHVESGVWTPKKGEAEKRDWDKRHGY